jgi:hypothetical protein
VSAILGIIKPGTRIRFDPQGGKWWWTVKARDERFIIATQQEPFRPKGTLRYTVVDLTGWTYTYNFVSPGIVRSSINLAGGGYGEGVFDVAECERMLEELRSGELELSTRRVRSVRAIEGNR